MAPTHVVVWMDLEVGGMTPASVGDVATAAAAELLLEAECTCSAGPTLLDRKMSASYIHVMYLLKGDLQDSVNRPP